MNFKPREFAPMGNIPEPTLEFAKRTLPPKTITPGGKVTTTFGKIGKGLKKLVNETSNIKVFGASKGNFKPGCLTD